MGGRLNLYIETSALLAWLFGERAADSVRRALAGAARVISSELTFVECERALIRGLVLEELSEAGATDRRRTLAATAESWEVQGLGSDVLDRARRSFPAEPLRALDALHLASALAARATTPDLAFLSLDRRCRENARQLGFRVLPEPAGEVREAASPPAGPARRARPRKLPGPRATPRRARKARPPARRGA